jgi:hypothetical protein
MRESSYEMLSAHLEDLVRDYYRLPARWPGPWLPAPSKVAGPVTTGSQQGGRARDYYRLPARWPGLWLLPAPSKMAGPLTTLGLAIQKSRTEMEPADCQPVDQFPSDPPERGRGHLALLAVACENHPPYTARNRTANLLHVCSGPKWFQRRSNLDRRVNT